MSPADKGKEEAQAAPAPVKAKAEPPAEKFTKSELQGRMRRAVGHPPYVIAGALHGVSKDKLTLAEAKVACEKWLSQEVEA